MLSFRYWSQSARTPSRMLLLIALAPSLVALLTSPATAQQAAGPGDRPASFDRSAVRGSPDPAQTLARPGDRPPVVRFARQSPQVGDQVEQAISVELRMTTSERHGVEVTGQTHSVMCSTQQRVVTTSGVAGGLTTAVKLRYVAATRQMGSSDDPSQPGAEPPPVSQPVAGKVYQCRRVGDRLVITDARGDIPPLAEYEIVAQQMEMLGRPNPLADFLAGQTIYVGQRLSLPNDVAKQLLGMEDRFGRVTRFDLVLAGITSDGGTQCAVFQAEVEAASHNASQMRLLVSGPMVIQTDSCRTVRAELSGPIGTAETRGSYSTKYFLTGTGNMAVGLTSAYHDVRR